MNYLNIHIPIMGEEEFSGATHEQVGIWLRLATYCAHQENGGKILRCEKWSERQWMTTCGVEKDAIMRDSPLWKWDIGAVIVRHYPLAQEREVARKREAGRRTAKLRWDSKKAKQLKALAPLSIAQL